jgi:hypothetical protein
VSCRCTASNVGVDAASSASAEPPAAAAAPSADTAAAATEADAAAAAGNGDALALARSFMVDADDDDDDAGDDADTGAGLDRVSAADRDDAECDEGVDDDDEDDDDDAEVEVEVEDDARCRLMPSKNGCLSASAADMRRAGSNASSCRMRSTKHRSSGISCASGLNCSTACRESRDEAHSGHRSAGVRKCSRRSARAVLDERAGRWWCAPEPERAGGDGGGVRCGLGSRRRGPLLPLREEDEDEDEDALPER